MSDDWRDRLPPPPENELYRKVVSGGSERLRQRRERRNTALGVAAGVIALVGLAGLVVSTGLGGGDDDDAGEPAATTAAAGDTTAAEGTTTTEGAVTTTAAGSTTTAAPGGEGPVLLVPPLVFEAPTAGASCGPETLVVTFVPPPPATVDEAVASWSVGALSGEAPMMEVEDGFVVTIGPFPADAITAGDEAPLLVTVRATTPGGEQVTETAEGVVQDCTP